MKTSKIVLLLTAAFILCFSSCQNDLVPVPDNDVFQYSDGDELLKKGKITRTVPFKGRYATYPEPATPPDRLPDEADEYDIFFNIPGEGEATHLGLNYMSSLAMVDNFLLDNGAESWVQTGNLVFEKKGTGDQLTGHYKGKIGTNYPDHPFLGSGDYWIISGTGKFAGVKGSGTYAYTVNNDMIGDCRYTGTLTFPK